MKYLLPICILLIAFSCTSNKLNLSPTATLISDINIVDVATGEVLNNKYIIIDSGKIVSIQNDIKDASIFSKVIDGSGNYAVPGLAEMHAHIPPPSTSTQRIDDVLFLYLSNGITTIRGMLGDSTHLALREKANIGEILSPRIFTSSPSLNGGSVKTVEEAELKVRKYKNDGYDFLKIHPGIKLDVFDQIVTTSREVGIPFSGHVPVDVGIRHALKSQYASVDHVDGFIEGLVPAFEKINPEENGFFGYDFTLLADPSLMDDLVMQAKENKVWIVPTQSLFERWFAPTTAKELLEQEEMKYMRSSTLRNWLRVKTQFMEDEKFDEEQWRVFDSLRRQLIHKLQVSGHGILMGSDAPQLFNVPGFSIHHEIKGMQNAGMTNLQILKSGTINPATFFNMENTFGKIEKGMEADIIIITGNPLEDLGELKNLIGVMRLGKWLSKDDIEERLLQIAENAEGN